MFNELCQKVGMRIFFSPPKKMNNTKEFNYNVFEQEA